MLILLNIILRLHHPMEQESQYATIIKLQNFLSAIRLEGCQKEHVFEEH
ncbi:hypothetical protein BTN50_2039 [Candidatus Enterovibrio altilux]|uniref:Uncharacterized protein n=1 Tax=Candidatus Enterovibrio altilux TaxID=1927128 RepID=A0A291BBS0_9GAMM|nr:hypothetical protein BTN50_2039 [Candidatus Enterovibrio luxaltus]